MKAWVCRGFDTPFRMGIEEVEAPRPGPDDILIEVHAAGLSYGETLVLEGRYQKTPPLPYIPGHEVAGIVRCCGSAVAGFAPGDRVGGFSIALAGGALAELCAMPRHDVYPLPAHMGFADGASFPMNYWTAYNALVRRAQLAAGETLVVHGATGGTGSAALDIGRALGARTIATGRSADRLRESGADARIDLATEDLRERLLELTGGRGADVFFDPVGGDLFDASLRAIAPGGRILVVGFTSGRPAIARTNVLLVKMVSVIGVEARLAVERTGDQGREDFRTMLGWIDEGRLRPRAASLLPFEDAAAGYRRFLEGGVAGKSVVIVKGE